MKQEEQIIMDWRKDHDLYAGIDRNQLGHDKVYFSKGNHTRFFPIEEEITVDYLNRLYEEFVE
jgi:hypothetical protein